MQPGLHPLPAFFVPRSYRVVRAELSGEAPNDHQLCALADSAREVGLHRGMRLIKVCSGIKYVLAAQTWAHLQAKTDQISHKVC